MTMDGVVGRNSERQRSVLRRLASNVVMKLGGIRFAIPPYELDVQSRTYITTGVVIRIASMTTAAGAVPTIAATTAIAGRIIRASTKAILPHHLTRSIDPSVMPSKIARTGLSTH